MGQNREGESSGSVIVLVNDISAIYISAGVFIPVIALCYGIPLLICAVIVYVRESVTICKRIIADACHAVSDRHARKSFATSKRITANARNAIGDIHARKAVTICKRCPANFRHAVGDIHARKSSATVKRIIADARHAVFNGHGFDI